MLKTIQQLQFNEVLLLATWKETASALNIQKGISDFEIKFIGWIFLA